MLNLSRISEGFLDPIAQVVQVAVECAPDLSADRVMLVGAWCRDVFQVALGHDFRTRATRDVDLALALSGWETYETLAATFPRVGNTGIRFEIGSQIVDLLPFGDLEDPKGIVRPPTRDETMSVWAFEKIFSRSLPLDLTSAVTIRIPTIAGYAAAKLAAWLDRSQWGEPKDANDLALVAYWYSESPGVADRLYDTPDGQRVLVDEGVDLACAAARLLGWDVADAVGSERLGELLERWPGDLEMLVRNFTLSTGPRWMEQDRRRRDVIDALTRGLADQI